MRLTRPRTELDIIVNQKLGKAGIDPCHQLINRQYTGNVKQAEASAAVAVAVAKR